MSNETIPLKLTAIVTDVNPRHAKVRVWQNGGMAGTLTVEREHANEVAGRLNQSTRMLELLLWVSDVLAAVPEEHELRGAILQCVNVAMRKLPYKVTLAETQ